MRTYILGHTVNELPHRDRMLTCALEHVVYATCKLPHVVLPEVIEDVLVFLMETPVLVHEA